MAVSEQPVSVLDDGSYTPAPEIGDLVRSFGARILKLAPVAFVAVSLLLTFLRTGIYLSSDKATWVSAARAFPHHAQYYYESWLYLGLPHLLGLLTLDRFIVFYVCVAVVSLVMLFAVPPTRLGVTRSRLFILAVLASGIPPTISYEIGFYDQLVILGAILVAVCRRRALIIAGALILSGANPSQAVVASLALAAVSFAPGYRQLRQKAVTSLAISILGFAVVHVWLAQVGVGGRETQVWQDIHYSLKGFATAGGLLIASWYGAAWLLVAALVVATPTARGRFALAVGLVILPGLACLTTLDGTRVFVSVSALPFVCCAWEWAASRRQTSALTEKWVGALAIGTLIVPALFYRGDVLDVWLPWSWLLQGPHLT
jgi:hypothetical protein